MLCLFEKFVGFGVWVWHIRQAYQTRVPGSKIDEYPEVPVTKTPAITTSPEGYEKTL